MKMKAQPLQYATEKGENGRGSVAVTPSSASLKTSSFDMPKS
jgi:hypothetical protein